MSVIPGFSDGMAEVNGQTIAYSTGGDGPPVLLLHGFPQMRAMWHGIAPVLAENFTVIAADLRGYGDSSKPAGTAAYAFREMATDQVALMQSLGHGAFHLVGHDRGARVAHRLALDHEAAVRSLTLMDIIPTHLLLSDLKTPVAKAYYHWFFLAQPTPFPETMIGMDPDYYFESCLTAWDEGEIEDFDAEALFAYRQSWRWPDCIHAMCNCYRAAIEIDVIHDGIDLMRKVPCPALVMYGSDGAMSKHYDVAATWADRLADMRALPMPGGHFFPDLHPKETAAAVLGFLRSVAD
ncbi:MAG: alpha/beta fold hydrolase [Arenibacterium sp.]